MGKVIRSEAFSLSEEPVTLPKMVKVGPYHFAVLFQDLHDVVHGDMDGAQERIRVDTNQSLTNQRDSFLHEVLHACSYVMGIDIPEEMIRPLATMLLGVLIDNPALPTFLVGGSDQ